MEKRKEGNLKKKGEQDFIFGVHPVIEAIRSGKEIDKLLLVKGGKSELLNELSTLAYDYRIPVSRVPVEKLNRITRKNHQGAIALISAINFSSLDHVIDDCYARGEDPFILVLDGITDVRNFGAIARTALCVGVHALVVPAKNSTRIGGDAVKTSAGALNYLPVCRVEYLKKGLIQLKQAGLTLVACTEKSRQNVFQHSFSSSPVALMMGAEDQGIEKEHLALADVSLGIPMLGEIASLNVSVAAAVSLYEIFKQRSQQRRM